MIRRDMYARPAGLSDDDDSDDEGFSFHDEPVKYHKRTQTLPNVEVVPRTNVYESCGEDEQMLQLEMMRACMLGNLDIIENYVRSGHDANDFMHTGWTPLLYAASSVCPGSVEYLLGLGVDVNKHKDGYTPLMALCNSSKGTTEGILMCLQYLIAAKCDVNAKNKNNETALMFACKMREPEVVRELLKHVDNIDFANTDGMTALFYAVMANRIETVRILLENKVVVTKRDRHNNTAKDIAVAKGFQEIASLLGFETNDAPIVPETFENVQSNSWRDMFPMLCKNNENCINYDVATMLYGMGMERYKFLFKGIDLKTFLKLTEDDLIKLGIDMPFQRREILDGLHKFHVKNWSANSFGAIRKNLPFTIYDGVVSLGHAAKHIRIIGSSFRFLKNSLIGAKEKNLELSEKQKIEYKSELNKTEQTLLSLENELQNMKSLANKIHKDTKLKPPATYIGPKKKKYNWTIVLSITLIMGIYLSRTAFIQRILKD